MLSQTAGASSKTSESPSQRATQTFPSQKIMLWQRVRGAAQEKSDVDTLEQGQDFGAECLDRRDDDYGDERGDQGVFDGGRAARVAGEGA